SKCALIVDDSASARLVLQRMLSAHNLDVDTAESAEDAMVYLSEHRPDVIFMDHMMPGMDGFEAVQAIKANPATATIPIMMYTSQEGELYVGQARALGAVGVLPKQIEPVEVSRVLASLRLIPGVDAETLPTDSTAGNGLSDSQQIAQLSADDVELRSLIQTMFEQQRAVLRRDLLDSYETIAARVAEEIAPEDMPDDQPMSQRLMSGPAILALSLLVLAASVFAFLYWQAETRWQQERQTRIELARQLLENQQVTADGTLRLQESLLDSQQALENSFAEAIELIAWSFNTNRRYSWDAIPFDDSLALELDRLSSGLDSIGFVGTILVTSHVGDFCYLESPDGSQVPAPDAMLLADCAQRGLSLPEADQKGSQQSVSFANLLETIAERTEGRIVIATSTLANTLPVEPYPADGDEVLAGAWNRVARASNRIVVELRLQ
ncbi:MAG: response regulator, partial [Pseudomonadota bacterium]